MKTRAILMQVGLCASLTTMALAQGGAMGEPMVPVSVDRSMINRAEPLRIAPATFKDGKIVTRGAWQDYHSGSTRATGVRIFDCYGDEDSDGAPDNNHWYFPGYKNLFVSNDMTLPCDAVIADGASRFSFSWWWEANGSSSSEYCIIGIFTQGSVPCTADSFDYEGYLLDFGTNLGATAWYADVDLASQSLAPLTLPSTGAGSYLIYFLQGTTSSGGYVQATSAQPFLWGTGDAGGASDNRGTQIKNQLDDYRTPWLQHQFECERARYDQPDIIPTVLGAAMELWGNTDLSLCNSDPCLDNVFPNCNGDGSVNTQDFLCFLGLWSAGNIAADCNGDNTINTQDFLCFLGLWSSCQ